LEEEITAPASFDIKEFFSNIFMAFVLLGEAKRRRTGDVNKVERFLQKINNP